MVRHSELMFRIPKIIRLAHTFKEVHVKNSSIWKRLVLAKRVRTPMANVLMER